LSCVVFIEGKNEKTTQIGENQSVVLAWGGEIVVHREVRKERKVRVWHREEREADGH
jgi:hypothetical protein